MLWDPLNAWPPGRWWLWISLCGLTVIAQGSSFLETLEPRTDGAIADWPQHDFFRNWAAARCLLDGVPVYSHQTVVIERYLGFRPDIRNADFIALYTHPPGSVWLAIPVAGCSYPWAIVIWNAGSLLALIGSLAIIARELKIRLSALSLVPTVTLMLVCNPLRQQLLHGQLNLVLLSLMVGTWAASRNGFSVPAGALLGIATAAKLFPGFLVLYFLIRRDWKAILSCAVAFAIVNGATWAVQGGETFLAYIRDVIPYVSACRSNLTNASLSGLWSKLLAPGNDVDARQLVLILHSPLTAQVATLLSCLSVTGITGWAIWRAVSPSECDLAFGVAVTAMLLVSPVTWDHYLLLLTLPLGLTWARLPQSLAMKAWFLLIIIVFWLNPVFLWDAFFPHRTVATPLHTLTVLSGQFYAILGLFILNLVVARRGASRPVPRSTRPNDSE